ncbi:MAG TPA: hypothetical protein PKD28_03920 [Candidatus Saccharibacteria bacterium]|nr:hypothetical protein [Candidatus Saccharibacteria bacterium]
MKATTWEHYNKDRYVDAVKITRFALDHLGSSGEIYEAIGHPLVSRTDSALSRHITISYREANPDYEDNHGADDIIRFGVRDTQGLLFPYLSRKTSRESALAFLHHDRTMGHLAIAALRTEESFEDLVRQVERDTAINPAAAHIELPFGIAPQEHGCPAAAIGKDRKPTKEFIDLSILSGEVLIEALDHHGRFTD